MGGIALAQTQICPCCGTVLKQPDWSEKSQVSSRWPDVWRCTNCGYFSETRDKSFGHEPSAAELAEKFLPKLVVE